MARKVRRTRKKAAARSRVAPRAKRRVTRRRKTRVAASATPKRKRKKTAKRRTRRVASVAAPKRKRKKSRAKSKLKANRRRRMRRNYGTSVGARRGWRVRKKKYAPTAYRKRSRKARKTRAKSRRRASAAPKRKRRKSRAKLKANRRRSYRRHAANPRRRRRSHRRARMSSNRRRSHRRRHTSNRRRRSHRRNGRKMFRKNGVMDTLKFMAVTGGLALAGFSVHKILTNLAAKGLNKIFGAPAAVVAVSPTQTATTPATSGLGGFSIDPTYQKLGASALVAGLGIFASAKLIKDAGARNTVMTGFALSFTHSLLSFALDKFAPQYSGMLSGDGTAARLSAMYGLRGTSIQPRYQPIGEYFSSGVNGMGEYFSATNGLGEYFSSGVNGLGALPSYEANAGYGANPDMMEAAAGMGAGYSSNTNHIDPHGDLDRELTIAEAAAGVGAYEAAAGMGAISTLPSTSTWIPGTSDGQIWAGTRAISAPQSASEMVPAGILQTDGGQGVFG